ncbi:pantoate--beta-alanine ligase [Acetobacteraceae bacterium]|nr:pantoate--beta-alanine ligase [Acetobacteraceae bacterium]
MQVCRDIKALQKLCSKLEDIAFVPTMGALHKGHMSLISKAKASGKKTVVSIFVNRAQFNNEEDFNKYPQTEERDLSLLESCDPDIVFIPSEEEIYPEGFEKQVIAGKVAKEWEGADRPGHFDGVTTILAKFLNIIRPEVLWLGQKDAQQVAVVANMIRNLNFSVSLKVAPIVREADGLAYSSRNVRLSKFDRQRAPEIYRGLKKVRAAFEKGERQSSSLESILRDSFKEAGLPNPEYAALVDSRDFSLVKEASDSSLAIVAMCLGKVRLLDNFKMKEEPHEW